jgi:hypothetical protein
VIPNTILKSSTIAGTSDTAGFAIIFAVSQQSFSVVLLPFLGALSLLAGAQFLIFFNALRQTNS